MTSPIRNRADGFVRPSTLGPQPTALTPPQQNTVAPSRTSNSSAQFRSTLDQSGFETTTAAPSQQQTASSFETTAAAPSQDVGGAAPVNNGLAVAEPAPAAPPNPHAQLDALKQSSIEDKKAFLQQFGVDAKHLNKAKESEINAAFDKAIDSLKNPGKVKFKFKIGGKKYEAKINLDARTGQLEIKFKRKKGFFSKLGSALKKIGKIALQVASFIPGPIGVVARVANAVISAVSAFKKGDILGGIAGMAGAIAGGAGALAGKATAGVARTVANVATAVQRGATAVSSGITAVRNGDWSGLLGAVASGARGVADSIGGMAGGVANGLNKVADWATRGNQVLQTASAARNGDILGAITSGSELANTVAPNSRVARVLGNVSNGVSQLGNVQSFLNARN
ncbi:hypothetical protein [Hyalangium rubrum]|uniref:Uncharacterized protein n=1 Tax=Hyalangium rubrum TaxID=3103134 RepID=A0ABU5H3H5_9BACT|nr:hypothetical protein [Hyalangium sp. s54d21]MDY7227876.1 hypothetical protein [Hyalangium sp. s54d21]